ncbi:hypothetical protein [Halpernia sp.]|uniref:hypothetical protein n=1 Tax=Halpernia sp. TaxID=2782209 RepID=UPI003A8F8AAD
MARLLYILFLFATLTLKAQVGINTETPETTLDVVGKPNDTNHYDGIIPPRITGNQLAAKFYTSQKKGAIVFVIAPASNLVGQVINVLEAGLYYFDGNLWQTFSKVLEPIEYRITLAFNSESSDPLTVTSTWGAPVDYYGNDNREYLVSQKSYSIGTKNYAGLKGNVVFSKMNGFTNVNFQIYRSNDSTPISEKVFIDITKIFNDFGYVPNQIILLHTENSTDFFPALLENNTIQIPQTSLSKMSTDYYTRGEAQGISRIKKPSFP